jgi:hypothetical protein
MASRRPLTVDMARHMSFNDLNREIYALIEPYEAPAEPESAETREARLSRTFDQLPDVYAWILQLHAYFDHWTDSFKVQFGGQDVNYKQMRQKRDMCERAASAAKLRYEAASRRMTQLERFEDESRMARTRRG